MLQLGSFEQDRAMFGRHFALVRLPDNDAAAVYLHVLMLDDDFEFANLLFEFLHAPVQSRDLLGLNRHDLLRIFQFGGVGGRVLLALLRVEKKDRACQTAGEQKVQNDRECFHFGFVLLRDILIDSLLAHDIEVAIDEEQSHDYLSHTRFVPYARHRIVAEIP